MWNSYLNMARDLLGYAHMHRWEKCLLCSFAKGNHGLAFWEDVNGLYIILKAVLRMCRMWCGFFLGDGYVHPQHTTPPSHWHNSRMKGSLEGGRLLTQGSDGNPGSFSSTSFSVTSMMTDLAVTPFPNLCAVLKSLEWQLRKNANV